MTRSEVEAFNAGVLAVLDVAARCADGLASEAWKPAKEGAADALRELADAGIGLLRPVKDGASQVTAKAA